MLRLMVFSFQTPGPSGKNEEKANVLTEKIEDLVVQVCPTWNEIILMEQIALTLLNCRKMACLVSAQIEELGSEGRVEEAQGMMKLVEQLKEERELLSSTPSVSSHYYYSTKVPLFT